MKKLFTVVCSGNAVLFDLPNWLGRRSGWAGAVELKNVIVRRSAAEPFPTVLHLKLDVSTGQTFETPSRKRGFLFAAVFSHANENIAVFEPILTDPITVTERRDRVELQVDAYPTDAEYESLVIYFSVETCMQNITTPTIVCDY